MLPAEVGAGGGHRSGVDLHHRRYCGLGMLRMPDPHPPPLPVRGSSHAENVSPGIDGEVRQPVAEKDHRRLVDAPSLDQTSGVEPRTVGATRSNREPPPARLLDLGAARQHVAHLPAGIRLGQLATSDPGDVALGDEGGERLLDVGPPGKSGADDRVRGAVGNLDPKDGAHEGPRDDHGLGITIPTSIIASLRAYIHALEVSVAPVTLCRR